MSRVLVVDDEPAICWAFREALTDDGHEVEIAASAEEALRLASASEPDLVLLDVRLPEMDGLTALHQLRQQIAETPIIVMTAFGSLDIAVQAMSAGAFDYLPKPFDLDNAVRIVSQALGPQPRKSPQVSLPSSAGVSLIGSSQGMQNVFRQIALLADRDVPVLITGESGTGKDLLARAIHHHSRRSDQPFVPICVPALSESVVESELFGHLKGAFTGAEYDRTGLLDAASEGTAFVDEIGDVSPAVQVKLLRVLETREILPVGATQPHRSNFRLIVATNHNLEAQVARGEFREDLFYRLNVFRIDLPPLREREDDAVELATCFLAQQPRAPLEFTAETIIEIRSRPWHGNVRELRNAIEYAAIVTRGSRITPDCLPRPIPRKLTGDSSRSIDDFVDLWVNSQLSADPSSISNLYERFLTEFETPLLLATLKATNGNRRAAADLLGMHRETLREKLKRHSPER